MQRQVETGNLWGVQKLRRVRFRTSALPFARLGTPQLMESRTLVLVGGAALAVGALRALFLILQSVQGLRRVRGDRDFLAGHGRRSCRHARPPGHRTFSRRTLVAQMGVRRPNDT